VHEIEELKLPGGFVELVTAMTGVEIKNIGLAKFGLLLFTLYATVVPAFLAGYVWPVMATLFIGCIEVFAHLAAAGVNPGRFYSPGMITALCVQFPVAVYGYWQLFADGLVRGNILALGGNLSCWFRSSACRRSSCAPTGRDGRSSRKAPAAPC
jgi:hypothetical protein